MSNPIPQAGTAVELTYESNAGGNPTKDCEVVDGRAFESNGFVHITLHLRDLDRGCQDQLTVRATAQDGEIVHSTVYGYAASTCKAREYGRRLGRDAEVRR